MPRMKRLIQVFVCSRLMTENYYVEVNDEGRTGEATLTSCYVNETEGGYVDIRP